MGAKIDNIKEIRLYLKNQIINNVELHCFEDEKKELLDLLKRTVTFGESNSSLLIGPRGVGKTTLVKNVLKELEEGADFESNAVLVLLNGYVHTDDQLSLKSITAQLNLANAVDGKSFGSFAENLTFLLACLKTGEKDKSKSIVFILEEFDLFCAHHNQTLLYNLLDVSQSAQTPVFVFGVTCRLDVIELFEKRVKSRFSHRQIFMFPKEENIIDSSTVVAKVKHFLTIPTNYKTNLRSNVITNWNERIKKLAENKKFKTLMQRLLDIDYTEKIFRNILFVIVSKLNENKASITLEDFEEQMKLLEADDIVLMLRDLTVLEICLVVAMKHHVDIYDDQPMNFEMIFTRYSKFANENANMQTVPRLVALKAFEHLQKLELISPASATMGKLQKEYQLFLLLVTSTQLTSAIKQLQMLPTEVVQWASSSLL